MANIKSDTNIKLPISFIVFALVAFVASLMILFFNSSELLGGQFRIPQIWMSAHFLLLGFAVMVAMGAMYQLVPVAFLTPIWNQTFGFYQFFVTAIGIGSFSILLGIKPDIAIYGGILTINTKNSSTYTNNPTENSVLYNLTKIKPGTTK